MSDGNKDMNGWNDKNKTVKGSMKKRKHNLYPSLLSIKTRTIKESI